MYITLVGNPFEGFVVTGPFADLNESRRNIHVVRRFRRVDIDESWSPLVEKTERSASEWRELARTGGAYVRIVGPVLGPWRFKLTDRKDPRTVVLQPLEERELTLDAPVAA